MVPVVYHGILVVVLQLRQEGTSMRACLLWLDDHIDYRELPGNPEFLEIPTMEIHKMGRPPRSIEVNYVDNMVDRKIFRKTATHFGMAYFREQSREINR